MKIVESIKRRFLRRQEHNSGESLVRETGLYLSTEDRLRRIVQNEMFRQRMNSQAETFAEADDFEMPEVGEWVSPYENEFEPETPPPVTETPSGQPASNPPPATPANPASSGGDNNGPPQA